MGRRRPSKRTPRTAPSPSSSPVDSEPEGPDLIGALPDCVLHSILSLLPVKDAARTSVLSSHWTNLWKAAPLRLDDDSINPERRRRTRAPMCAPWEWSRNAVSRLIDSHHGPIETLHLSRFARGCDVLTMGRIVESAVRRPGGIQQVSLDCYGSELPLSLLHCNSLHQLSLYRCTFPPNLPPLIFPNLIKLQLSSMDIYKDLVQNLLSQCRSLQILHMTSACYYQYNNRSISISSPSLRELDCYNTIFRELIIEDAPNLVSLMCDEYRSDSDRTYYKVKVLHAPKLE
ncbi:hypothetical protein LUZ61_005857 [Rhynchospora tenuis]|uniref:F-box domain-containing protein n=1 Tax=Rhynchospora tenuis TaxID=198213 RepID=A0AAD5ZQC0_9POAL|nr:hypothetical protein LUZ61_005857 [Rhynchospora tenuis]